MQVRILAVIALLVLAVAARPKWHELEGYTFEQYMKDFDKSYVKGTSEYTQREAAFTAKLGEVTAFNKGSKSYKKGINGMSDWTPVEAQALNGRVPGFKETETVSLLKTSKLSVPLSMDYRRNYPPVLTAVKNQGRCGSCWAQTAAASIESSWAIATGKLYDLSQQQMTSCVANPQQCGGTGGCKGATAQLAFDYVAAAGGLTEEWQYPYTSFFGDQGVCAFNTTKTRPIARISAYVTVPRNADAEVAAALFQYGPLAVSVDATPWHDYETGVFAGCDYSKNITMNHAVQLIGYGHDDSLNLDYWIIRNSWSASWGESGYIRLLRTKECGWNVNWGKGGGCKGDPQTVWACGQCGVLYDAVFPLSRK